MPVTGPIVASQAGTATDAIVTVSAIPDGALIIASLAYDTGNLVTPTAPAGFTLIRNEVYEDLFGLAVWSKVASGEPGSYTFGMGASVAHSAQVAYYEGTTGVEVNVARADQYGIRNFVTEPLTTLSANSRVVALMGQRSPTAWTAPAGWALQGSNRSGLNVRSDVSAAILDQTAASAGAVTPAVTTARVGTRLLAMTRDGVSFRASSAAQKIKSVLESDGWVITYKDMDDSETSWLNSARDSNQDVLVVPGEADGLDSRRIRNADIGFVHSENVGYDDAGFARLTSNRGSDKTILPRPLNILLPDHPIVQQAGVSGQIQMYEDPGGSIGYITGTINPNLSVIAQGVTPDRPAIFAYEKGVGRYTAIAGTASTTPSRMVGFPLVEENAADPASADWTPELEALYLASLDYAARYRPSPQIVVMLSLAEEAVVSATEIQISDVQLLAIAAAAPAFTQVQTLQIPDVSLPLFQLGAVEAGQVQSIQINSAQLGEVQLSSVEFSQVQGVQIAGVSLPTLQPESPTFDQAQSIQISGVGLPTLQSDSPNFNQAQIIQIGDTQLPGLGVEDLQFDQRVDLDISPISLPAISAAAASIVPVPELQIGDAELPGLSVQGVTANQGPPGLTISDVALPNIGSVNALFRQVADLQIADVEVPVLQSDPLAFSQVTELQISPVALPTLQAESVRVSLPGALDIDPVALLQIESGLVQFVQPANQLAIQSVQLPSISATGLGVGTLQIGKLPDSLTVRRRQSALSAEEVQQAVKDAIAANPGLVTIKAVDVYPDSVEPDQIVFLKREGTNTIFYNSEGQYWDPFL